MNYITTLLYWISTGLLVPVMLLLLYFFVRALWLSGRFYGLCVKQQRFHRRIHQTLSQMSLSAWLHQTLSEEQAAESPLCRQIEKMQAAQGNAAWLEKLVGDYEIAADKAMDTSRLLAKIGPILGLMGTLIPMGPALMGLSTGDVEAMAANMQVAFATTVIGLIIGAVGFITLQLHRRWAADELNLLEYLSEKLKGEVK